LGLAIDRAGRCPFNAFDAALFFIGFSLRYARQRTERSAICAQIE
jgi:hypothetical protein